MLNNVLAGHVFRPLPPAISKMDARDLHNRREIAIDRRRQQILAEMKEAAEHDEAARERTGEAKATTHPTCPQISVNPLNSHTRINGHTIQRVNLPLHLPKFTTADCTAHLSHEEWWASLDYEIKMIMDSKMNAHGTGEHLAHLDSEGRFHAVNAAKWSIERNEYLDRVNVAMTELAESMGLRLAGIRSQSLPPDHNTFVHMAYLECPDGGEGKLVAVLPCGRKIFTKTPEGFTNENFQDFSDRILGELMERISNAGYVFSASRMERFFENNFEERFA